MTQRYDSAYEVGAAPFGKNFIYALYSIKRFSLSFHIVRENEAKIKNMHDNNRTQDLKRK